TGLDPAHAFQTIQRGVNVICDTIDLAGHVATVHVADGNYGAVVLRRGCGSGTMQLLGNLATPASCVISTNTAVGAITLVEDGTEWIVRGFRLFNSTPTNGNGIYCAGHSSLLWQDISFGACTWAHIGVLEGGYLYCTGSYSIDGSAYCHIGAFGCGTIDMTQTIT